MQANSSYSQKTKISLDVGNATMEEVIDVIEANTEFKFIFNTKTVNLKRKVSISVKKVPIKRVLDLLFSKEGIRYEVEDRKILLTRAKMKASVMEVESAETSELPQILVSGTITDQDGTPLPGANILEKGTTNGTQADFDGNFSISVEDESAVIVISYVGFATKEVNLNGMTNLTITLEESAAGLDEVVVVGYGSQKKSDLTGSITSLQPDDFNKGTSSSPDQLILGKAAGVRISESSGEPGGAMNINIRGASSINATNQPLYVIDGFAIDNSPMLSGASSSAQLGNSAARNPLNAINPSDIASIQVLKDASATAIYGSRGANGVIIVTTKSGKHNEKTVFDFSSSVGVQNVSKRIDLLTTSEFIDVINGISSDAGNGVVYDESAIASIGDGTDWQDAIYRSAIIQNHNLSMSGGSEKSSYYLSLNYFNQEGVVKNTGIEKYIGRFNFNQNVGERVKLGVNINRSVVKDQNGIDGTNINEFGGPIYTALLYDPTAPIYNEDGSFYRSPNLTINNPVSLIEGVDSNTKTHRTIANMFVNYNLLTGLDAKFNFGYDNLTSQRDIYNSTLTIFGGPVNGIADKALLERENILFEYTMNYKKELFENHFFNLLGGVTYQDFISNSFAGGISGFPSDDLGTNNLGLGDTNSDNLQSSKARNSLFSYLTRLNYNLYNKYLLTASFRADGSSRFGENNKYGYFPSFALGWKINEEEFIPDVFNELKLRTSWGETGNQGIGNYQSLSTYQVGTYVALNDNLFRGVAPSRMGNPNLKWERTAQFNLGLDIGIINGRLSGSFDFFDKKTTDLLIALPIPSGTGFNSITSNVGSVRNHGFEFLINSTNINTENFEWSTSFNFSAIKNEVIDLGDSESIINEFTIIEEGSPLNSYYGYEITGIFQQGDDIANSSQPSSQTGYPIFKDLNGDNRITSDDRQILGDPFPDFTYGLQNTLRYKRFGLDFFIQGQEGVELVNRNVIESMYPLNFGRNRIAEQVLNRWTPQNTQTKWPSGVSPTAYGGGQLNSLTIQDASYIRLKTVQLSYDFPSLDIDFIKSARVYIVGQNLVTITDYEGYNPESNSGGLSAAQIDYNGYPLARTIQLGLNVSF